MKKLLKDFVALMGLAGFFGFLCVLKLSGPASGYFLQNMMK